MLYIVRILFTAGSVLAAVVHASVLYHMHMDIVKELHFYGDQLLMETPLFQDNRASVSHCG